MKLKDFLIQLLKEDTPDEEQLALRQHTSDHVASSSGVPNTRDSEKIEGDSGAVDPNGGMNDEDDVDLEHDDRDYDDALPDGDLDTQPSKGPFGIRTIISRLWTFICPSPSDEEEIQAFIPHYRVLPIVSGIIIPFCILLEIPGLTEHWYILTDGSTIIASKPNPPLIDVGIALSISCAVLANICLVIRFLERRIKTMTILCALFLSAHDIINVTILSTFGATKGTYTFGQAFWMTLCSTITSMLVNVTLIIDLIWTSAFKQSGSGLTRRQRSLVIIMIGLFCYITLGGLVNTLLLNLTFINGLYFTVVTIETIGFGDIVPNSSVSRVFICFYATIGVVNLAFVVGYVRETVLEGLDFGYRRRLLAIQEKRRATRLRRRAEKRWRHAVIWRLRRRHEPVWIPIHTSSRRSFWLKFKSALWRVERAIRSTTTRSTHQSHHRHGMKLNLGALPRCQLEAAALEAGVPLDDLLPSDFYDTYTQDTCRHSEDEEHRALPSWFIVHSVYHHGEHARDPLTHRRLGAMAVMLTKLSFSLYESGGVPLPSGRDARGEDGLQAAQDSSGSLQTSASEDGDYRTDVVDTEKRAYYTRSGLSWGWFLIFWLGGAFIFKTTEGWTYGNSVYFCFIAFSTIGYGDVSPATPAGRSIFVVWALVGVATITIFVSVVSEAYTSRYKGILGRNSFKHIVQKYHKRTKVELSEKVQRIGSSTLVKVVQDTVEREETDIVEDGSSPANASADDGAVVKDLHVQQTQQSLDQFPQQVLTETRSIHRYIQLIGDFDSPSTGTEKVVNETLKSLVDDIMGRRKLSEDEKVDILKDGESRRTLMMLGIERSLEELVNISENAIAAIHEQNKIIAALEREREQAETNIVQR